VVDRQLRELHHKGYALVGRGKRREFRISIIKDLIRPDQELSLWRIRNYRSRISRIDAQDKDMALTGQVRSHWCRPG
jgi:hypothetical protein